MAYKASNNGYALLAVGLAPGDTTMQVASGKGDMFPVISGGNHTYLTLENAGGAIEVVKVTARASGSDSMTIVRAQDGTTAKTWLSGDIVECRPCAAAIADLQAEAAAAASAAVSAHEAAGDPHTQYATNTELTDGLAGKAAASHAHSADDITSGTLAVARGGTGGATPEAALTALGAQAALVSGTNIKTIDGTSILGSGDIAVAPDGAFRSIQVFTSSGTWTKPAGLKRVKVTVVGAGGGGRSAGPTAGAQQAGAAGGAHIVALDAAALAESITVTVGAGGSAGSAGGTSSFGAHCSATGGAPGPSPASALMATGGIGSGAGVSVRGGPGRGLAGGGDSILGGGAPGNTQEDSAGAAGGAYGGGGGGGYSTGGGTYSGGSGGAGVVIVEEFF